MTTNVLDIAQGVVASDSRWSIPKDWGIAYVDDTGFDKIEVALGHAFLFAGHGGLIHQWKEWIRRAAAKHPSPPEEVEPPVDGIALCVVRIDSVTVVFEYGQDIIKDDARFAGTGSYHAHLCWDFNRCAKLAVESAKKEDKMTGGEVKFVELHTGNNNLTNSGSIKTAMADLLQRGWIMYSNARTSIRIGEAVANDERVAELVHGIASGSVVANAPCDSMYNKWSDSDKVKLSQVLDSVFNRKTS